MKRTKYTWIPDLPDVRDHLYQAPEAALPPAVDLRNRMPPVFDQGQLGSCTGNAFAGAVEFLEPGPRVAPSRLFIYYNERLIEHTVGSDAGARIRDGVKTLAKYGWASEKIWPYKISAFKTKPTKAAYTDGAGRKITAYLRITDLQNMKTCIASGFPFVFGFSVYDAFESASVAKTGILNVPGPGEKLLGGHAVLCVGYDDASQRVIVRNSWGPKWGQAGYFTMPYAYISNTSLADDMWTVRK